MYFTNMKRRQRIHTIIALVCLLGPIFPIPTLGQSQPIALTLFEIEGTIEDNYANLTYSWELDNTQSNSSNQVDLRFEVSEKLFLSNVSIKVGDLQYYGVVKKLAEAQQDYTDAVENNQSAILIERNGNENHARMNIEAEISARIEINFEGYITRELGLYELQLLSGVTIGGLVAESFNIDLAITSSTNNVVQTKINELPSITVEDVTDGRLLSYSASNFGFEDLSLSYRSVGAVEGGQILSYSNGNENFFAYFFAPEIYSVDDQANREYVFTIDTSGSMGGDRIINAKTALSQMIGSLGPDDFFNVVEFNTESYLLWAEPHQANANDIDEALDWVSNLDASGSTNINSALESSLGSFQSDGFYAKALVFLSDGEPTAGVTSPTTIRENLVGFNINEVSIFSISIGTSTSEGLMSSLAADTGGKFVIIQSNSDIVLGLNNFYQHFSVPVAGSVSMSYTNVMGGVYPTSIGSGIFNGTEVLQVGTFSNDLEINMTVHYADQIIEYSDSVVSAGTEKSQIEKIWAVKKIEHLLTKNLISRYESVSDEIVDLALKYSIVVPGYTGLVLVVEDPNIPSDPQTVESNPGDRGFDPNGADDGATEDMAATFPIFSVFGLLIFGTLFRAKISKNKSKYFR